MLLKIKTSLWDSENGYERCVNAVREKLLAMQIVSVENLPSKVYNDLDRAGLRIC